MWARFSPEETQRRATVLIIQLFRVMWNYQIGLWANELEPLCDTLADIWLTTLHVDEKTKA